MFILLAAFLFGSSAFAYCPGGSYREAIRQALKDFATDVEINGTSGSLRLSVINVESEVSAVTLRSRYFNYDDIQVIQYRMRQDATCAAYTIEQKISTNPVLVGFGDAILTKVLRIAFDEYLKDTSTIPLTTHSGTHSLTFKTPKVCGQQASINIVRTRSQSSRLVHRVTSYLVDLPSGRVVDTRVTPGRGLPDLCP